MAIKAIVTHRAGDGRGRRKRRDGRTQRKEHKGSERAREREYRRSFSENSKK